MSRRPYRAPDLWLRCSASVRNRDGEYTQCMRPGNRAYMANPDVNALLCDQHADLKLLGRLEWVDGAYRLRRAS